VTESSRLSEQDRDSQPAHDAERESQQGEETATEECPDCGGRLVTDESQAERHCEECGRVVETEGLDHGPEWRAFSQQEKEQKSRVGSPETQLLHDRGLSTKISWQDEDARGNRLSERKRRQIQRLRTWDERYRATDSKDRNLRQALGEIDRMASALGLPQNVRETASVIYRRALNDGLLPGRSIEGMATAALYAAARLDGVARSLDEMAVVSRVEKLELERTYSYLTRELGLGVPPTNPGEYIGRFASALDCTDETERRARVLVEQAVDEGVHSGKHPVGIAASALYGAGQLTGEKMTQAAVSEVASVSKVTIRNRYREVMRAAQRTDGE
jgi:transcription initiation factor TFIIB